MLAHLTDMFKEFGWVDAPPIMARSMGSSLFAFVTFGIPGATWRVRVGERVCHLERRTHGNPRRPDASHGRCTSGRWESIGSIDTPRTRKTWREFCEALTGEAFAFESALQSGGFGSAGASQHYRRNGADGSDTGGVQHGRGRVGRSNPSRLDAFGFAPSAGYRLLSGRGELIDATGTLAEHYARIATPDAKVRAARKARRKARRAANLALYGGN